MGRTPRSQQHPPLGQCGSKQGQGQLGQVCSRYSGHYLGKWCMRKLPCLHGKVIPPSFSMHFVWVTGVAKSAYSKSLRSLSTTFAEKQHLYGTRVLQITKSQCNCLTLFKPWWFMYPDRSCMSSFENLNRSHFISSQNLL